MGREGQKLALRVQLNDRQRELCGVLVLFFLSHGGANSFNDFVFVQDESCVVASPLGYYSRDTSTTVSPSSLVSTFLAVST